MATEQSEAIILHLTAFSETSLVVTAFTRGLGQVAALAKGAYRPKSPFDGSLDLLSVCRLVLITKPGDTLDILTESKLQRRFRAGQWSQTRLHAGYYLAELLRQWTAERDRSEPLFDLALESLSAIDCPRPAVRSSADGCEPLPDRPSPAAVPAPTAVPAPDALWTVLRFEVRGLQLMGLMPSTRLCVVCGQTCGLDDSQAGRRLPFAYELGGVLCEACRPRQLGVVWLRPAILDWLESLAASADLISLAADPPQHPELYRELRATVSRLVSTTLSRPPRTQSLLPASWVSH